MSCSFVILDANGSSYTVTDTFLDADGTAYTVGIAANDADGASYTIGTCPVVVTPSVTVGLGGKATRSAKRGRRGEKLVILDEIDEIEEILDEIEEAIQEAPKKQAKKPVAKPQEAVSGETVFDWIGYYQAMLYRLRDQHIKAALQTQLMLASTMAMQAIRQAEERARLQAILADDEEVIHLLMAA